ALHVCVRGLSRVALGAAAAELDGKVAEHPLQTRRIADVRRLRDFDGVLQLVSEERHETALGSGYFYSNMEITIFALRHDVVGQVSAQGLAFELSLDVYDDVGVVQR